MGRSVPPLEYSVPTRARRVNRRTIAFSLALVVMAVALTCSLRLRHELILSNHGRPFPVRNEESGVWRLVHVPSSRAEADVPYIVRSFAGFHIVDWPLWHHGGKYLLIPKWAIIVLTGGTLGVLILLALRPSAQLTGGSDQR